MSNANWERLWRLNGINFVILFVIAYVIYGDQPKVGASAASFPAAMLIMAGTFGLWRAGVISNALFWAGVAAVVLVLLGGTTWASDGIWAPDGAYSRLISPIVGLAWIAVISGLLTMRVPSTARAPERPAVPAP